MQCIVEPDLGIHPPASSALLIPTVVRIKKVIMSSTVVEAIVPVIPLALFLSHTPSSGSIPDAPVPNLLPAVLARRWFCAELEASSGTGVATLPSVTVSPRSPIAYDIFSFIVSQALHDNLVHLG